ncbi:MAG: SH3 domain-containing protein, partial [Calditrichaeota bacterium]
MKGRVTANLLNIRSLPSLSARIVGTLPKDTVISIRDEKDNWLEINYQGMAGYVSADWVFRLESEVNLKGRVSASLLNVRREPALHSDVMGSLILDSRIDILDETGEWLEIAFNG